MMHVLFLVSGLVAGFVAGYSLRHYVAIVRDRKLRQRNYGIGVGAPEIISGWHKERNRNG